MYKYRHSFPWQQGVKITSSRHMKKLLRILFVTYCRNYLPKYKILFTSNSSMKYWNGLYQYIVCMSILLVTMCVSKKVRISCLWHYIHIYISLCTLTADLNLFRGTHCILSLCIFLPRGLLSKLGGGWIIYLANNFQYGHDKGFLKNCISLLCFI